MKKIMAALLTTLFMVSTFGALNASAAALDSAWSTTRSFNMTQEGIFDTEIKQRDLGGGKKYDYIRDLTRTENAATKGYFMVSNSFAARGSVLAADNNELKGTYELAADVNHTENNASSGSLKMSAASQFTMGDTFFATFLAYTNAQKSETEGYPSGFQISGSCLYNANTGEGTFHYNNCKLFEHSFYIRFAKFSKLTVLPEIQYLEKETNGTTPFNTHASMRTAVDEGGYLSFGGSSVYKRLQLGEWYQIKQIFNFMNNTYYVYFDGECIGSFKREGTWTYDRTRGVQLLLEAGGEMYIDDIYSGPSDQAISKFVENSEAAFTINDAPATTISAGAAVANVKLYNDFSEKSVTLISAVYENDGSKLKNVTYNTVDLTEYKDKEVKLSLGNVTATDTAKVMMFDSASALKPIKDVATLSVSQ